MPEGPGIYFLLALRWFDLHARHSRRRETTYKAIKAKKQREGWNAGGCCGEAAAWHISLGLLSVRRHNWGTTGQGVWVGAEGQVGSTWGCVVDVIPVHNWNSSLNAFVTGNCARPKRPPEPETKQEPDADVAMGRGQATHTEIVVFASKNFLVQLVALVCLFL